MGYDTEESKKIVYRLYRSAAQLNLYMSLGQNFDTDKVLADLLKIKNLTAIAWAEIMKTKMPDNNPRNE